MRAEPPSTTRVPWSWRPPMAPNGRSFCGVATGLGWRSGALTSDEAVAAYRDGHRPGDRRRSARRRRAGACDGSTSSWACRATRRRRARSWTRRSSCSETEPEPGDTLAELYACRSEAEMFAGRSEDSLTWAEPGPGAASHAGDHADGAAPARERPLRAGRLRRRRRPAHGALRWPRIPASRWTSSPPTPTWSNGSACSKGPRRHWR